MTIQAEQATVRTTGGPISGGWNLYSDGMVGEYVHVKTAGTYLVTIRAYGSPVQGIWPLMALSVDGLSGRTATVDSGTFRNYVFRVPLDKRIHLIGASFLNDARSGTEDRNLYLSKIDVRPVSGPEQLVLSTEREWALIGKMREDGVLRASNQAIRKSRMGTATITVVDGNGRPVPGVSVSVEQKRHGFLFGCNLFMFDRFASDEDNAAYKTRFKDLFNYATLPFFWNWLDPTYEQTDKLTSWCTENGIRMKGHPLLWDTADGVPPRGSGQPSPEAQEKHVKEIMQRYHGKIEFWEVVNEPSHLPGIPVGDPYRWARETSPSAHLIINDFGALSDGNPVFFGFLKNADRQGVPYDGIGIQGHEPREMAFPLDRVQAVLDMYAALGKKIHITELALPSSGKRIAGSPWRDVWSEVQQADYVVKFYRVCFAHPAVAAITWWDLSDQGSWLEGGGMLRADLSPKPLYDALRKLIHEEWRTVLRGRTDGLGRFRFSGFYGAYDVVLESGTAVRNERFHLADGAQNKLTYRIARSR